MATFLDTVASEESVDSGINQRYESEDLSVSDIFEGTVERLSKKYPYRVESSSDEEEVMTLDKLLILANLRGFSEDDFYYFVAEYVSSEEVTKETILSLNHKFRRRFLSFIGRRFSRRMCREFVERYLRVDGGN